MLAWMAGARLVLRWARERNVHNQSAHGHCASAVIVGNIEQVDQLIRSIKNQISDIGDFAGIVTDEVAAHGLTVRGVKVYGSVDKVGEVARNAVAGSILILPPYTRPKEMNNIMEICDNEKIRCSYRMIPSFTELASGILQLSSIRKVEIEDLLGRPTVSFDRDRVKKTVENKVVMITGAGGSIGSELARQLSHYKPKRLVLFEHSEFNLYKIDMELRATWPDTDFVSVAGSIEQREQVNAALVTNKVEIVYHAAAYKHVPLMEVNVCACVQNNTIGSSIVADESEKAGVERFVLVSSDKAVRPTSVMGASKRLAERVIMERPKSKTRFVAVRFGNVLGSSGSVIPLFRKQIEKGGPVTVTGPNVTRFFMTIPEAVDLLLQASVIGDDREIMILEMGEPIKISAMARRLIKLSGLRPDEDIEIVYTGLRPGEKEYEELLTDEDNVVRTPFDRIFALKANHAQTSGPPDLIEINRLIVKGDAVGMRSFLCETISDASRCIAEI
jgi:FlaA1/EpsC-like NDP-sugar epimerase